MPLLLKALRLPMNNDMAIYSLKMKKPKLSIVYLCTLYNKNHCTTANNHRLLQIDYYQCMCWLLTVMRTRDTKTTRKSPYEMRKTRKAQLSMVSWRSPSNLVMRACQAVTSQLKNILARINLSWNQQSKTSSKQDKEIIILKYFLLKQEYVDLGMVGDVPVGCCDRT